MKCPNCSLILANSNDICTRCGFDLRPKKGEMGIDVSNPHASAEELREKILGGRDEKGISSILKNLKRIKVNLNAPPKKPSRSEITDTPADDASRLEYGDKEPSRIDIDPNFFFINEEGRPRSSGSGSIDTSVDRADLQIESLDGDPLDIEANFFAESGTNAAIKNPKIIFYEDEDSPIEQEIPQKVIENRDQKKGVQKSAPKKTSAQPPQSIDDTINNYNILPDIANLEAKYQDKAKVESKSSKPVAEIKKAVDNKPIDLKSELGEDKLKNFKEKIARRRSHKSSIKINLANFQDLQGKKIDIRQIKERARNLIKQQSGLVTGSFSAIKSVPTVEQAQDLDELLKRMGMQTARDSKLVEFSADEADFQGQLNSIFGGDLSDADSFEISVVKDPNAASAAKNAKLAQDISISFGEEDLEDDSEDFGDFEAELSKRTEQEEPEDEDDLEEEEDYEDYEEEDEDYEEIDLSEFASKQKASVDLSIEDDEIDLLTESLNNNISLDDLKNKQKEESLLEGVDEIEDLEDDEEKEEENELNPIDSVLIGPGSESSQSYLESVFSSSPSNEIVTQNEPLRPVARTMVQAESRLNELSGIVQKIEDLDDESEEDSLIEIFSKSKDDYLLEQIKIENIPEIEREAFGNWASQLGYFQRTEIDEFGVADIFKLEVNDRTTMLFDLVSEELSGDIKNYQEVLPQSNFRKIVEADTSYSFNQLSQEIVKEINDHGSAKLLSVEEIKQTEMPDLIRASLLNSFFSVIFDFQMSLIIGVILTSFFAIDYAMVHQILQNEFDFNVFYFAPYFFLLLLFVFVSYGIISMLPGSLSGQTKGQAIFGTMLLTPDGEFPSIMTLGLRFLLQLFCVFTCFIGFLPIFGKERRTLPDYLTDTVMVRS